MLLAATSGIAKIWLVEFGPKLTTRKILVVRQDVT